MKNIEELKMRLARINREEMDLARDKGLLQHYVLEWVTSHECWEQYVCNEIMKANPSWKDRDALLEALKDGDFFIGIGTGKIRFEVSENFLVDYPYYQDLTSLWYTLDDIKINLKPKKEDIEKKISILKKCIESEKKEAETRLEKYENELKRLKGLL